ncbi:MAG: hypothetical protein HY981_04000 [Candidatus Magasanikbacteria bacterium]|nr:hypothetical protein [Candidatus Magasanikbacteria bacterium]
MRASSMDGPCADVSEIVGVPNAHERSYRMRVTALSACIRVACGARVTCFYFSHMITQSLKEGVKEIRGVTHPVRVSSVQSYRA